MNRKTIWTHVVIVVAILVVANVLSEMLYFRLDFTEDQRYTFSKATKDVVDGLDDVVTITAYFSEDLPPQLLKSRQDFQDLLIEYENRSNGNIVYQFVNPNESEEREQEAQQNGIGPVMINVTERDQVQQMRAYMGAVIKMSDRAEVIPLVQPGTSMEYDVTTALKKVSIADKPKLGLIQGYGEPSLRAIPQLLQELNVLYDVEPFSIRDTSSVPAYYRALIWIYPKDSVDQIEFAKIDRYLAGGGGLFVAHSPVDGDLQQSFLSATTDVGLQDWLASKGIDIGEQMVIDANCGSVSVQQRQGFFTINSQIEFPYFPVISNFGDHPATKGLESVLIPFVGSLSFNSQDTSYRQVVLAQTSENTGLVTVPTYLDIQRRWQKADFPSGPQIVAAALEKPGSKLVVIANGTFCVNGESQRPQQLNPDNVNLAANAIDWIADDTGLIDLRTKGVTARPLDELEDSTKTLLKYGNVFAPILLILIYALYRRQARSRARQRWMQGNYA